MKTAVCDLLGIEFPIFAFSHCRDVVAAVSRAGGIGVLGAVAYSPEDLEVALSWLDDHVGDRPYGVDVIVPAKYIGDAAGGLRSSEVAQLIPEEHRAFVDDILERYGVADFPAAEAMPLAEGQLSFSEDRPMPFSSQSAHDLLEVVIHTPLFSGFCYTQFADTFQEANGLLCADRTPKISLESIRRAVTLQRTYIPGGV